MKIGILGGCFNPPHRMHEQMATYLLDHHIVDQIIYVPTGNHYQKTDLIDNQYRFEMLQLIANKHKNMMVSDYELTEQLRYTYQTLQHFQKKYPNDTLYFIMGSDNVQDLISWKELPWLLENCQFLVINRNHKSQDIVKPYHPYENHFHFISLKEDDISSTTIRKLIENNEVDKIKQYVNDDIYQYIVDHHLYQKN